MNRFEIRAWRQRHGMTQGGLAAALGVQLYTVQRWEWGQVGAPNMLHLALRGLEQDIAEHGGDVLAVSRDQLAREAIGLA